MARFVVRPRLRSLFRPRYSLRALLACLGVVAALVAVYRGQVRDRLESFFGAPRAVSRILILGPPASGTPVAIDPPSPAEVVKAMDQAGMGNPPVGSHMLLEPIADYVDPPVSSLTGSYQLHHAHYKCTIKTADGTRTLFIDHNHRCVP